MTTAAPRVIEIDPVKMEIVWSYPLGRGMYQFFSTNISGAQRLPNGNTLITEGMNGRLFEVTPDLEIVWEYVNPFGKGPEASGNGSNIFRATRYPPDFFTKAFNPKDKDIEINKELKTIQDNLAPMKESMETIQTIYPSTKRPRGKGGPRGKKGKGPIPSSKSEVQP